MRSSLLYSLPLASAAVAVDQSWSYEPDKTADWYQGHSQELPKVAPEITTVEAGKSYVVKLDCVGCPFRVRQKYELVETWQEHPQDSSLLLNFTISEDPLGIFLDDKDISILPPRPPPITAFQIPGNTSQEIMSKMVDQNMMSHDAWNLGTKYGTFELEYEHALLATPRYGEQYLQFDVTRIHMRSTHNPGSYSMDRDGQKMVQLLLVQDMSNDKLELTIKDIQVIERQDRQDPIKMDCGKYAIITRKFNPLEWDYYGKFGTAERAWHQILWDTLKFIDRNGLIIIIVSLVAGIYSLVRWVMGRNKRQFAAQPTEDAEVGLLQADYTDAPPEYTDTLIAQEQKGEEGKGEGR
ncbi:hypothetical protein K491DRAFT_681406 [Lophiostoma macrostomum CBS 122681]|uniref:Uncharacterized protein n=1 Tax=Lophiostoma macrostomum CBS 122681 TaxID=1314788 RepID=A0A6A6SZC9_9PLEO|nr:hypothetical protein K491DRAFT_681406 [Lophiostoma macrostomum CBS 122681]